MNIINLSFPKKIWPHCLLVLKIILGIVITVSFFIVIKKNIDPDLGWHLRVGEQIVQTRNIPYFDTFSYTMAGHPWVDHEWSADILLWLGYNNHLWLLIEVFFTFFAVFPFLFWIQRAKNYPFLFAVTLASLFAIQIIGVRLQVVSFFLFFLVYEFLYRWRLKLIGFFWLYFLPPIFLLWANLHAGFSLGLGLLLFFLILLFFDRPRKRKRIISFAFIFTLSAALALVNPYGIGLYQEVVRVALSSETAKYIQEWQPGLFFINPQFAVFLGIFIFTLIAARKKVDFGLWSLPLVLFLAFLKSVRLSLLFIASALPLLHYGWAFLQKEIDRAQLLHPAPKKIRKAGIVTALIVFVLLSSLAVYSAATYKSMAYPDQAIEYLKKNPDLTALNIFNEYGWGGYLIWKLPRVKVFIDGRMPHWKDNTLDSAMADYISVTDKKNWEAVFAKRNVSLALIKNQPKKFRGQSYLARFSFTKKIDLWLNKTNQVEKPSDLESLLENAGWRAIYKDAVAVILKKP